jgi:hypothetical protein
MSALPGLYGASRPPMGQINRKTTQQASVTTRVTTDGQPARPSSAQPLEHHQCDNVVTTSMVDWCALGVSRPFAAASRQRATGHTPQGDAAKSNRLNVELLTDCRSHRWRCWRARTAVDATADGLRTAHSPVLPERDGILAFRGAPGRSKGHPQPHGRRSVVDKPAARRLDRLSGHGLVAGVCPHRCRVDDRA